MILENEEQAKIKRVLNSAPDKIVLSNLCDKTYIYKKTVISKIAMKDKMMYQIERFTDKQAFHENIGISELADNVFELFTEKYKQMNVFLEDAGYDFKVSKKGKLLSKKSSLHSDINNKKESDLKGLAQQASHNRKKNYILKEGTVIPPLVDLGIFTKEGKVVRSMYDKFKQINRFIELVDDVVKNYHGKEINIIDFGCGKSYLTFIMYYYLVELRGMKVKMTGLDLKKDVIEKCNATAKKYHYDNLHFELGDINGYKTDEQVDMVVTLHACDTATDYALYNAINWNASVILSVPCCQHEINAQIESDDYSILTRYGIIKERVSALMTDAIRANVLEYCGYNTQLLEFIDIAHSPKNILIRAVRRNNGRYIEYNGAAEPNADAKKTDKERACWNEAERLCEEFHIVQTLMGLVRD